MDSKPTSTRRARQDQQEAAERAAILATERREKLRAVERAYFDQLGRAQAPVLLWESISDDELAALLADDEPPSRVRVHGRPREPSRALDLVREEFLRRLVAERAGKIEIRPILPWPTVSGVYFLRVHDRVKIGVAKNVARRLSDHQCASPFETHLLAVQEGGGAVERELHKRFAEWRVKNEWFLLSKQILEHIVQVRGLRIG